MADGSSFKTRKTVNPIDKFEALTGLRPAPGSRYAGINLAHSTPEKRLAAVERLCGPKFAADLKAKHPTWGRR